MNSQPQSYSFMYLIVHFCKHVVLYKTIHVYSKCSSAIIAVLLYPYAWAFLLLGEILELLRLYVKKITNTIIDFSLVIPLSYKVTFWYWESGLTYWCSIQDENDLKVTMNTKIYPNLERILNTLGLIPVTKDEADALAYYLELYMNVIFGRLPYPSFFIYHTQCDDDPEDYSIKPAKNFEKNTPCITCYNTTEKPSENLPQENEPYPQE